MSKIKTTFNSIFNSFLSFPCPVCGESSNKKNQANSLCDNCASNLQKIQMPYCSGCGGTNKGFLAMCDKCIKGLDRPWKNIIAVYEYDYLAGKMLRNLKYNNASHMVKSLISGAVERISCAADDIDFIIPIPLHYSRLLSRGFNQSELLAVELREALKSSEFILNKKYKNLKAINLLSRRMRTKVQMTLAQEERLENMQGVFKVRNRLVKKHNINENSNILLIDDVLTTGATLKFATEALNDAGFKNINVLVLARR